FGLFTTLRRYIRLALCKKRKFILAWNVHVIRVPAPRKRDVWCEPELHRTRSTMFTRSTNRIFVPAVGLAALAVAALATPASATPAPAPTPQWFAVPTPTNPDPYTFPLTWINGTNTGSTNVTVSWSPASSDLGTIYYYDANFSGASGEN